MDGSVSGKMVGVWIDGWMDECLAAVAVGRLA